MRLEAHESHESNVSTLEPAAAQVIKNKNHDLDMPEGLSPKAQAAWGILVEWAQEHKEYTGGCKTFYPNSP